MTISRSEADLYNLNFPMNFTTFNYPDWNNKNQSSANSIDSAEVKCRRNSEEQNSDWPNVRRKLSEDEKTFLEKAYEENKYVDVLRQNELAVQLNVSEKRIQNWFRGRRVKERKATGQVYQNPYIEAYYQTKAMQRTISLPWSTKSKDKNPVSYYNRSNYWLLPDHMAGNPYWRSFGHYLPYPPRYPLHNLTIPTFLWKENPEYFKMYPTLKLVPPRYPMPIIDRQSISLVNESE